MHLSFYSEKWNATTPEYRDMASFERKFSYITENLYQGNLNNMVGEKELKNDTNWYASIDG